MGDPSDKRKYAKRLVTAGALLVIGLTGIAAVKVVPPMIFHQRIKAGLEAVMKTPVEVGDATITFDLSTGNVKDVTVANPAVYTGTHFVEFPRVTFEIYSDSMGKGPLRFKHITLHKPVLFFETRGASSNLRDMIELMVQPGGDPMQPVIIDRLVIEGGKIHSMFEYGDNKPVVTDFPLKHIEGLEGNAGEIAGQFAQALQNEMNTRMKESAQELNDGLIQKFKALFKQDDQPE